MKQKSYPGKFSMLIRSAIFSVVGPVFTIFYSFICLASYPLPLHYRYQVVMFWCRSMVFLLKVLCRIDYEVKGLENIPRNRVGIIMSKHQSAWETFYIPTQFHNTAIIAKRELLWLPFFGWGMAVIDPISINRSNKNSAMNQIISQGQKCLTAGRWILVFPEGTRVSPGQSGKYRLGGARLASATHAPVIPVAHNAGCFWSKRKFIKTPGTIQIVFGPIIESEGRIPDEILKLTKHWIETTMQEIDPYYASSNVEHSADSVILDENTE